MKLSLASFLIFMTSVTLCGDRVAIMGCGYVGLTLASLLVNNKHKVVCIDIDNDKILGLKKGELSIYEPQLADALFHSRFTHNLAFSSDIKQASDAEIFYICVATPTDGQGNSDCSFLQSAFNDILKNCRSDIPVIICVKSTVPPGTIRKLHDSLIQAHKDNINIIYNPEFMREGTALQDMYTNNPVVLGGESLEAIQKIESLYADLLRPTIKIIRTNFETAEIIKYAWNSFSALRITFINELALFCKLLDADISTVISGFSLSEDLLPTASIKPGPGYGGSCLPKDVLAFSQIMKKNGFDVSLIHHIEQSNTNIKTKIVNAILSALDQSNPHPIVTLLGLAFKANTNDVRNSPAIDIIEALLERNITVKAYDPQANNTMKNLFPSVEYFLSPYDAMEDADCVVVLTDWEEIKNIDFDRVLSRNKKIILDTRNIDSAASLKKHAGWPMHKGLERCGE